MIDYDKPYLNILERSTVSRLKYQITEAVAVPLVGGGYNLKFITPNLAEREFLYVKARTQDLRKFKTLEALKKEAKLLGYPVVRELTNEVRF